MFPFFVLLSTRGGGWRGRGEWEICLDILCICALPLISRVEGGGSGDSRIMFPFFVLLSTRGGVEGEGCVSNCFSRNVMEVQKIFKIQY